MRYRNPDWDIDYDEPEEFGGDYTERQLVSMGLTLLPGRIAWRRGYNAVIGKDDPERYWDRPKPYMSPKISWREWDYETAAKLLEVAPQLTQLAGIYYDAGLYGSKRYPGPPVEALINAAFYDGVKWGEKEISSREDYYRRLQYQFPVIGRQSGHIKVIIDGIIETVAVPRGIRGVDVESKVVSFQARREDINLSMKLLVLEGAVLDTIEYRDLPIDLSKRTLHFGGDEWDSRPWISGVDHSEVAHKYLVSPYFAQAAKTSGRYEAIIRLLHLPPRVYNSDEPYSKKIILAYVADLIQYASAISTHLK